LQKPKAKSLWGAWGEEERTKRALFCVAKRATPRANHARHARRAALQKKKHDRAPKQRRTKTQLHLLPIQKKVREIRNCAGGRAAGWPPLAMLLCVRVRARLQTAAQHRITNPKESAC
jgi:hypothetical protein